MQIHIAWHRLSMTRATFLYMYSSSPPFFYHLPSEDTSKHTPQHHPCNPLLLNTLSFSTPFLNMFSLVHLPLACSQHTHLISLLQRPSRIETRKTHQATSSSSSSSSHLSPKTIHAHMRATSSEFMAEEG